MKDLIKGIAILVCCALLVLGVCAGCLKIVLDSANHVEIYETNDIQDYGVYTGNCDNGPPTEFITSFFPEKIDETFTQIVYHYKAKAFDTYAYEAYLEFVIEDENAFSSFLNRYVDTADAEPFLYDNSLLEYSISNVIRIQKPANESGAYAISYAEIGKILYSTDEQRIIFVAIGVYDGGGTDTSELDYFFSKFQINCANYQNNAFYTHEDQMKGILFKDR